MQPFSLHTGLVAPLDRAHVDTDQMIPKQFCKLLTRQGYGKFLFYNWRYLPGEEPDPAFVLNWGRYKGASILLARTNFACGSSREHAAWGVQDYGFRAVLAPSFGDIFYNNCFKNGILPVRLADAQMDELFRRAAQHEGYRMTVDLPQQTVTDDRGLKISFEIDPFRKNVLLKGLDDIGLIFEHESGISAYEKAHPGLAPVMFDPVDVKISKPAS